METIPAKLREWFPSIIDEISGVLKMVTKVVNLRKERFDVYIGRGSKWGNRFVIGPDGSREEVIRKYREWILANDELLACLGELKDKVLGCYCKPLACHGDVLVNLIETMEDGP